jgi:hypothetical protein
MAEIIHLWSWRAGLVKPAPGGTFHGAVGGWVKAPTGEEAGELALAAIHIIYPPESGAQILDMAVEQIPDDEVLLVAATLREK